MPSTNTLSTGLSILLLILLLLLLCNSGTPQNQSKLKRSLSCNNNNNYNYNYIVGSPQKCSKLCDNNSECSMWLFKSNQTCFIITNEISSIILDEYKDQLLKKEGLLLLEYGYASKANSIRSSRIVGNMLPFNSQTLYNQQQHFSYSCKYTISLWVWIWKGPLGRLKDMRSNGVERAIFSSRPITDLFDAEEGYLPSIIFNLAVDRFTTQEDSLFFSATRDENGDYSGFRPKGAYVRYNQWMHIMMSLDKGKMHAFIDGKLLGIVDIGREERFLEKHIGTCPYNVNNNSSDSNNVLKNNSIFQVLGQRHVHDISTTGMTQDVLVLRNYAVKDTKSATAIMKARVPETPYSLVLLLRSLNVYSLDGFSPIDWQGNPYIIKEWNLCNPAKCSYGDICVNPRFLLGILNYEAQTVEELQTKFEGLNSTADSSNSSDYKSSQTSDSDKSKIVLMKRSDFSSLLSQLPEPSAKFNFQRSLKVDEQVPLLVGIYSISHDLYASALTWFKSDLAEKKRRSEKLIFYRSTSSIASNWRERRIAASKAWSALVLALWLLDDVFDEATDMDIPWSFPYPALASQPILKALAFLHGVDSRSLRNVLETSHYNNPRFHEHIFSDLLRNNDEFKCYTRLIESVDRESVFDLIEGMKFNKSLSHSCNSLDLKHIVPDLFDFITFVYGADTDADTDADADADSNPNPNPNPNPNTDAISSSSEDSCDGIIDSSISSNCMPSICRLASPLLNSPEAYYHKISLDYEGKITKPIQFNADLSRNEKQILRLNVVLDTIASFDKDSSKSLDQYIPSSISIYGSDVASMNENEDENELNSISAGSLLFPITQFVASHNGVSTFGVSVPESLLLANGDVDVHATKAGSDLFFTYQMDAKLGDVEAMKFLGRRYFWGLDGEAVDINQASYWFQQAANKDDPEGLYNLGVMYLNGQGGLQPSIKEAFFYINRSAHGASIGVPFLDAVHALGNIFRNPEYKDYYNEKKAKQMFKLAAQMDCRYGHFSYAMVLKDENKIGDAIAHLCRAGSLGNLRATNYLAHALFDKESWFYHTSLLYSNFTKKSDYNKTNFAMIVGNKYVEIPWPLTSKDQPGKIALILLKYVSSFVKVLDDALERAYKYYGDGDYTMALQYFDEAMILGDSRGTQNSIYIIEAMRDQVCPTVSSYFTSNNISDIWELDNVNKNNSKNNINSNKNISINNNNLSITLIDVVGKTFDSMIKYIYNHFEDPARANITKVQNEFVTEAQCNGYFDRNLIARYVISLKSEDDSVLMDIAERISNHRYGMHEYFPNYMASKLIHASFMNGEVENIADTAWGIYSGSFNHFFEKNATLSRFLFKQISILEKKMGVYIEETISIKNASQQRQAKEEFSDEGDGLSSFDIDIWDLMVTISVTLTYFYDAMSALGLVYLAPILSRSFLVLAFNDYVVKFCLVVLTVIHILDSYF